MELHLLYINYNLQMKTEHILNVTDELLDDFWYFKHFFTVTLLYFYLSWLLNPELVL